MSFLWDEHGCLHGSPPCIECQQMEAELPEDVRSGLVTIRLLGLDKGIWGIPYRACDLKAALELAGIDPEPVLQATSAWRHWYRVYLARRQIRYWRPSSMSEIAWRSIVAALEPLQPLRLVPFRVLGSGDKRHFDAAVWDSAIQEAAQPVAPVIWTSSGAIVGEERISWDLIKRSLQSTSLVIPYPAATEP
jgi:hypothetical protein